MKIVTAVVNNVEFIKIQHYTLKKYFKGDYEFIVFNDAKDFPDYTNYGDNTIKYQIELLCNDLNIKCINIPNEHHKQDKAHSKRASDSMNYILEYQKQNPDKYLLLDSDMFLIDYFDINKYSNYECAIVLQSRNDFKTHYFWNGIYYFDMLKMKNIEKLNWNCVPGLDTGGMMKEWLELQMLNKKMPNTDTIRWTNESFHTHNTYFIKHLWSCSWDESEIPENLKNNSELIKFFKNDIRNTNNKYFCEIYDNVFLHYRAGGNWLEEGKEVHQNLTNTLLKTLIV
jgi:hypothetical protein